MTPAKIYPFSIPAGGSFPLLVIGDYAKILTSSGPLTLQGDTFGSIGPILAGQGVQDSPFSRLVLKDESGATNNGTILIADNAFIDDRITGEVSVIDGEINKTLSGKTFSATGAIAGLAANYSIIELWNPAGSGRNLIVYELNISSSSAGDYRIGKTTVTNGAAAIPGNKLNGAAGVAKSGFSNSTNVASANIEVGIINAYVSIQRLYKQPVICPPSTGLTIASGTLGMPIYGTFNYVEEAIL